MIKVLGLTGRAIGSGLVILAVLIAAFAIGVTVLTVLVFAVLIFAGKSTGGRR